jgi:hypothetical protein
VSWLPAPLWSRGSAFRSGSALPGEYDIPRKLGPSFEIAREPARIDRLREGSPAGVRVVQDKELGSKLVEQNAKITLGRPFIDAVEPDPRDLGR